MFTGSSLETHNARADLSRRAVVYSMQGLSFREYLNLVSEANFASASMSEINRHTLLWYIHYLSEAGLIRNLHRRSRGTGSLQKPDKIYLENTNMMFAFQDRPPEVGTVRETFLQNQLAYGHTSNYPEADDIEYGYRHTIPLWLFGFLH